MRLFIFFLFIILMAIGIIRSKKQKRKHRKTKNYKKKTIRNYKNREKFVNNNTKFTEENSHYIVSNDRVNNDSITKKISKCNKILVDKEKKCNCYVKKNKTVKADKYSNYKHLPECKQKRFKNGCEDYRDCRDYFSTFMSHNFSEPEYEPANWSDPYIQGSHNCYAYFLDDQIKDVKKECQRVCDKGNKCRNNKKCGNLKPQPGHYCVDNEHKYADDFNIKDKLNIYNCPTILERVMCDNSLHNKELIKPVEFATPCPKDHYKGIVVIDSGQNRKMKNGHTYHFYRQDSNGRFSHKPGTLPVEDLDASNKPIYVPHLADTNYNKKNPMSKDGIHYDKRCSYMCIPRNYKKNTHAI